MSLYILRLFFASLLSFVGNSMVLKDTICLKKLSVVMTKKGTDSIYIKVTNITHYPLKVYSHVKTHEMHYDYFEVEALTPDGEKMHFGFSDNRDKSFPVVINLKRDESFAHTINFSTWSERSINSKALKDAGFNRLPRGIKIRVKYFNPACTNCSAQGKSIWSGYEYSDWISY